MGYSRLSNCELLLVRTNCHFNLVYTTSDIQNRVQVPEVSVMSQKPAALRRFLPPIPLPFCAINLMLNLSNQTSILPSPKKDLHLSVVLVTSVLIGAGVYVLTPPFQPEFLDEDSEWRFSKSMRALYWFSPDPMSK
jgi:hypothetical protein